MTPGEIDNAKRELGVAGEALRAAELALGEGLLRDATSRLYYAAFHAARASLTVLGEYSKTHSGLIALFHLRHGAAPILDELFRQRGKADYSMEPFDVRKEDLEGSTSEVKDFIARCKRLVDDRTANGPDEPDPASDL